MTASARPRRRLRAEGIMLIPLLAVTATVLLSVPREAMRFEPGKGGKSAGFSCGFVRLTTAEEAEMLRLAKTSWQVGTADARRLKANLMAVDIPEETPGETSSVADRVRPSEVGMVRYSALLLPTTFRMDSAAELDVETPLARPPAFSRGEMLEINGI